MQERIPLWLGAILVVIAFIFAVLGIIPIINVVAGTIGWIILTFIFYIRGVSYSKNPKMLVGTMIGFVTSIIPVIGGFLGTLGGILYLIYTVRKEDKKNNAAFLAQQQQDLEQEYEEEEDYDEDVYNKAA